ncbi:MAG TPA: hypothetical protein HPQ04_08465 [Rhodospirillaceae bacterium]|nr:hypothetical protein [Rhodospirillaceae bacterium]
MTADAIVQVVAAGTAGLLFGLLYFYLLWRTAELLVRPGRRMAAAGLTLGRIAGAVVLLALAARLGVLPMLAGLGGFLLARGIALRLNRTVP